VFDDLVDIRKSWGGRYAKWDRVDELMGVCDRETGYWNKSLRFDPESETLEYSALRSVRDAMRARLATRKPKPRAYTAGARYTVREKARQTTKQIKQIFSRSGIYPQGHRVFNDVMDYGIGFYKSFESGGLIRTQRVHPRMVVMDEPDYGDPSVWFNFFDVRKSALVKDHPDFESEIMRSSLVDLHKGGAKEGSESDDWTTVVESWYCPTSKDGRHIISVNEIPLVDDSWRSTVPGVVPVRFFEPGSGYVGDCLVDICGSLQDRIYFLLAKITDMMNLGGTLKILVDGGSGLDVEVMSNELIQVLKYNGTKGIPVQVVQIPAIDPVYFQELDRCEGKVYSLMGVSDMWVSSEKPPGLNSGKALGEMEDITSTRFLDVSQKVDNSFVDLAWSCTSLASSIPGFRVSVNGEDVPWKEIQLDEDEYDISIAPVSILPDTSPGVIQKIIDDAQLDANIAADQLVLFDSIDHEAYVRQIIAPKLACEKYLDEIFWDHKNRGLNPNLDLKYLDKRRLYFWNQAFLKEDERAMDMLEDLKDQIDGALAEMQGPSPYEQAQSPMGAPPGAPGGVPPQGLGAPEAQAPMGAPGMLQ
jgi:hypothetical protein